jgi:hypothetical protein
MPQTTDQDRAAFEAFFRQSRSHSGRKKIERCLDRLEDDTYADESTQRHWWTWQQSRAAVPLVAEAPREPVATLLRGEGGAFRVRPNMDALRAIYALPFGEHDLYAAPPASLAPMPEELPEPALLKTPEGDDYTDDTAAKWAWFAHGYDTGMEPFYSADQMRELAHAVRAAVLASVAPKEPEQPNTEQPHLADNGRAPVQGLDAADGVGGRDAS